MATKKLNGTVIVTYRCNARCTMCNRYKAPSKPEEEISLETIRKLPPMYFTNITGGYFTRHLARERVAYKARRDALTKALREAFAPEELHLTGLHTGLHLLAEQIGRASCRERVCQYV